MKLNTYVILERQVREAVAIGVVGGLRTPEIAADIEKLVDHIGDAVMGGLCEIIIFDDLVKDDTVKTVDPAGLTQPKAD